MRDIFAEEVDGAGVGTEQSVGEFEKHAFADAGGPKEDAGFIRAHRKAHILKHRVIEGDGDVAKLKNRPGPADGTVVPGTRWRDRGLSSAKDGQHDLCDKEINKDDEHGGDDDCLDGGAANALPFLR